MLIRMRPGVAERVMKGMPLRVATLLKFQYYRVMVGLAGKATAWETIFIVNPQAGHGSTGKTWPRLNDLIRNRVGRFGAVHTRGPGDAARVAHRALLGGSRRIVCVGGDGTLSEVVNGFMAAAPAVRRHGVLGFIPNGTGCDFVRSVTIPRDLEQAVDIIASGRSRPIDIGRLWFRPYGAFPDCRHFHNIASFGLGGEVCARVNHTTKAFGPFLSFLWATVVALLRYGKRRITFRVDDGRLRSAIVWNLVVANGRFHGGGMQVAPEALVDDGLFHTVVIGDLSFSEVCRHLPKLYMGRINDIEKVQVWTGRRIEATSSQRVLIEVDGEQPGVLPAIAEIVPKAVHVMMKENSWS